jgi:glutamate formiminotransferase/formiminotetrahydrofolate cyclodeaminase
MAPQSFIDVPVGTFLDDLGSDRPTPGGGAVAALAGALAAALGKKACALTVGKAKFAEAAEQVENLTLRLGRAEGLLRRLADEDAVAYAELARAFKLDRSDPSRRRQIESTAMLAATVPLQVAVISAQVLRDLKRLESICNPNLVSDVVAGTHMSQAAIRAAAANVRANLPFIQESQRPDVAAELEHVLDV